MFTINLFTTLYPVGAVVRGRENGRTAAIASEPKTWFRGTRRMETVQVLLYGDTPEQSQFMSMPVSQILKRYEPTGLRMPVNEGW